MGLRLAIIRDSDGAELLSSELQDVIVTLLQAERRTVLRPASFGQAAADAFLTAWSQAEQQLKRRTAELT